MARFRDWVEPAHPAVVQQFDDLRDIYKVLRESLQADIDQAFDKIARQIGFVVTTTVPVTMEVGEGGKIGQVALSSRNLDGTIFEREFAPIFKKISGKSLGRSKVAGGNYQLILIWFDALKLKLKHDWVEPAHFRGIRTEIAEEAIKVRPEVQEPAHWFDAGIALALEEELLIDVIDEIYPELRLADRVAIGRAESRKLIPGVREPAHFRRVIEDLIETRIDRSKLIPGVREPAHFRKISDLFEDPEKLQMLTELATLLRKLGF